jgi:hypothetical protein
VLQRTCWLLVAVVAAVFSVPWFRSSPPASAGPPAGEAGSIDPAVALAHSHEWVGTSSCAAASCHGDTGPKGDLRSAYTIWAVYDKPHGKAFSVLYDKKSERIAKNLGLKKPAYEEATCLNCHVHPGWAGAKHAERFTPNDGVGCESCHGPAGKWLTRHYQDDWKNLKPEQKAAFGFRDTKDLLTRGRTCVTCHVGAPHNDVNHDLIGAGHPRLNFEFGAYQAVLPRHWDPKKDLARYEDFEARSWAMGQAMAAEAAVRLTEGRARDRTLPWPEFAEYDCYACHHDLTGKSARQTKAHYGKRMPGLLPWGTWYTTMLEKGTGVAAGEELTRLRKAMETPYPNRDAVAKDAKALADKLSGKAAELARAPLAATPEELLGRLRLVAGDAGPPPASWDEAAQLYLALAALHHARSDLKAPLPRAIKGALQQMVQGLRFPPGLDSAGSQFKVNDFGKQLGIVREQLRGAR